jgi:hypothetical protein
VPGPVVVATRTLSGAAGLIEGCDLLILVEHSLTRRKQTPDGLPSFHVVRALAVLAARWRY